MHFSTNKVERNTIVDFSILQPVETKVYKIFTPKLITMLRNLLAVLFGFMAASFY